MYKNNTNKPIPIKINGDFVDVNPGDEINVPEGVAKRNGLSKVVETVVVEKPKKTKSKGKKANK